MRKHKFDASKAKNPNSLTVNEMKGGVKEAKAPKAKGKTKMTLKESFEEK